MSTIEGMTPDGAPTHTDHCRGCTCDLLARDVVLVEVAAELLAQIRREGWSGPVQVRIDQIEGTGRWEMTCRTADLITLMT